MLANQPCLACLNVEPTTTLAAPPESSLMYGYAIVSCQEVLDIFQSLTRFFSPITLLLRTDLGDILDLNAYGDLSPARLADTFHGRGFSSSDKHIIDKSVTSLTLEMRGLANQGLLDSFLQNLLWERSLQNSQGDTITLYRLKGVICTGDSQPRCVVQAVQELYDFHPTTPWLPGETRTNILVFIGKNLDRDVLEREFKKCITDIT
ncbi:hypothetical protein DPMN_082457 [Dreissena polymorpha]|uniref:CobW C-terminal domain-containing protein n=1 Tax=Dreissena polymorpha TaxID=45954 RepID=A0A9D3YAW5_DREPO|nr:hypothetical protein DPMN_082457 [Dreissena polymorpha]